MNNIILMNCVAVNRVPTCEYFPTKESLMFILISKFNNKN